MTLEVAHRHQKLAPESGVECMALISGAGFWSVCQGPKNCSRWRVCDCVLSLSSADRFNHEIKTPEQWSQQLQLQHAGHTELLGLKGQSIQITHQHIAHPPWRPASRPAEKPRREHYRSILATTTLAL